MAVRRATLADVAARAGVDASLVSKVLNNKDGFSIRESTRARVHEAARALHYTPSQAARSLRTSRTGVVGVLLPAFVNPIWSSILEAAEAEATRLDYTLIAGIAGDDASSGGKRTSKFLDWARSGAVDGLLVASELSDDELSPGLGQTPWLHINRKPDNSRRHVTLDDEGGMRLATEHLLELGHRRLAHLSGPLDTDSGRRRLLGFQSAVEAAGVTDAPFVESGYDMGSGRRAVDQLLRSDPSVTGIVCANVSSAAGALEQIHSLGKRVPEDLSVVALHDVEMAAALRPSLTTVRMPLEELGRRAVRALVESDPRSNVSLTIEGPCELVRRDSTAPPRLVP